MLAGLPATIGFSVVFKYGDAFLVFVFMFDCLILAAAGEKTRRSAARHDLCFGGPEA